MKGSSKVDDYGGDYETAAHGAAAEGDTHLLVSAVKSDPGSIQQKDNEGYTPLAHAVLGKHLQAVKRLVKMGADVNAQDGQGRTCVSIAAYQGWSEGLVYLLRKGARQDIVDKSGRTPLHAATYDTDTKPLMTLIKRLGTDELNVGDNEKMTALHWAAFHNRPDHVRQLLLKGVVSSLPDIDGKTPLHWAAQNGSRTCCVILVEGTAGGELVHRVDNCSKTALHLAAAAGHADILHDLANIAPHLCEEGDQDDRTPLHWAAATGHVACVRGLLKLGVTPDPRDVDGVTPLEYARNAGHSECKSVLENSERFSISKRKDDSKHSSGGGFFKGFFSKKKDKDARATKVTKIERLPDVIKSTKQTHKQSTALAQNSNGRLVSGEDGATKFSQDLYSSSKNTLSVGSDDTFSPVGDTPVPEGRSSSHRKKKKKRRHRDEDAPSPISTRTPSTREDDRRDNYNNVPSSRGIHLSPLGGNRALSISPRISNSPSTSNIKRTGGLSPLRTDRLANDRYDVPLPSNVMKLRQEHDGRSRSPTPPPAFNINGKAVLPEISGLTPEVQPMEWSEKKESRKKKKKRREDKRQLVHSPTEQLSGADGIVNNSMTPTHDWHLPPPELTNKNKHVMKRDLEEVMEMLDL